MALTFFWRGEDVNLDATHDFSAGDTIGTLASGATISSTAARIGTNGVLGAVSVGSSVTFTPAGIFPGTSTAPADSVGCMACSYQWKVAYPGGAQATGLRFRGTSASNAIGLFTAVTTELRFSIGNPTVTIDLTTVGMNFTFNLWYGLLARWDLPNNKRKLEIYDASNVLLYSIEDTSTDLSSAIPTEVDNLFNVGVKAAGNANTTWADCFMVGNTYNEPLQNNLTKSSYTLYDGSLGTPAILMGQVLS